MSIRVTCPGCLKKFQVSDQFAGKKGPCPSCKKEITIPDPEKEKVTIHAPEVSGPTDSTGQSVLKPIRRSQSKISPIQRTIIVATVVTFFIVAFAIRMSLANSWKDNPLADWKDFPLSVLIVGAIALGPPVAFVGYYFLKDEERGSFRGKELWVRTLICGILFSLLWFAPMLTAYGFREYSTIALVIAVSIMFAIGGAVAAGCFELEFMMGLVLFGLYFGASVLMRVIVQAQALPLEPAQ